MSLTSLSGLRKIHQCQNNRGVYSLFSLLTGSFLLVCLCITSSSVLSVFRGTHSGIWREGYQSYSNRILVVSLQISLSLSGDAHLDPGASFGPDGSREGGVNELL